ncbi:MAG: TlyA family RNA methyltransferase [Coriobacteriia bacterium]|nr:TlyA family RNA methyltransferase [Coriobacteriia bacterium]
MKQRLDQELVRCGLVATRSQAESYIRMGKALVDGRVVNKPGHFVKEGSRVELSTDEQFVSRAALKLKSVADRLGLDFADKVVLDIGSSTGGFTEYALSRGATKVIAVDVGTNQMHPRLRHDPRVELHENTDIRSFQLIEKPDIILIDVSFISSREVLPGIEKSLLGSDAHIVLMLKPQFETGTRLKNAGVIKDDTERNKIMHDFEAWAKNLFVIEQKADSKVAGSKGNLERFYLLRKT